MDTCPIPHTTVLRTVAIKYNGRERREVCDGYLSNTESHRMYFAETDFGQIDIFNELWKDLSLPKETPTECLYGRLTYCGVMDGRRIPIMLGSKLHIHEADNPLKMNGYFIVDGICKSISSMYVYDRSCFSRNRAYLTTGECITIKAMGEYECTLKGKTSKWFLPVNYEFISQCSKHPIDVLEHLSLVFSKERLIRFSAEVCRADAMILAYMFEHWLGHESIPDSRHRLLTPGEVMWLAHGRKMDLVRCFRTHEWPVKNLNRVHSVSENLKLYSMLGDAEAIRRFTLPTIRENTKLEDRLVRMCDKGKICPVQTADGSLCGTIMYLAEGARVSQTSQIEIHNAENHPKRLLYINGTYSGECTSVTTDGEVYEDDRVVFAWTSMGRILPGSSYTSLTVSHIPFYTHNPAIRAMFGSAMLKQALTMDERVQNGMFNDTKRLIKGEQPLVGRKFAHAAGWNLNTAIMPWYGYNVEDAIVISESVAQKYTTEKVMVFAGELNTPHDRVLDVYVEVNDRVCKGEQLLRLFHPGEMTTIEIVRSTIDGVVTKITEHERCVLIRVAKQRCLEVGDKMTSRHGQKGVVSLILPDTHMPRYIEDNRIVTVDLMINPHAFPSRMTIGQLHEMGNTERKMYVESPRAFEIQNGIIAGKCYYVALRHQVEDKVQSRDVHELDPVSLQALSGKSRIGGLRFGHMERDVLLAVGEHELLCELYAIDRTHVWGCVRCGRLGGQRMLVCLCDEAPDIQSIECHQHLVICAVLLKSLGYELLFWPKNREYAIVSFDVHTLPAIAGPEDVWFGDNDLFDLRRWVIPVTGESVPVLPLALRSPQLDKKYQTMFISLKTKGLSEETSRLLSGKRGAYHKLVEGHRVNHCVRSVIVPDPSLPPDVVRLPVGADIGVQHGLFNRQPSLDIGSMMSVNLVPGVNRAIAMNPLLCASFNADFDGDEMCVFGTSRLSAKCPVVCTPVQDYILGDLDKITERGLTASRADMELMVLKRSKGKQFNIKHMFESIGPVIVDGHVVGTIDACYFAGLSVDEWYLQAMAAREGAASIGVNTPFTGDLESVCNRMYI